MYEFIKLIIVVITSAYISLYVNKKYGLLEFNKLLDIGPIGDVAVKTVVVLIILALVFLFAYFIWNILMNVTTIFTTIVFSPIRITFSYLVICINKRISNLITRKMLEYAKFLQKESIDDKKEMNYLNKHYFPRIKLYNIIILLFLLIVPFIFPNFMISLLKTTPNIIVYTILIITYTLFWILNVKYDIINKVEKMVKNSRIRRNTQVESPTDTNKSNKNGWFVWIKKIFGKNKTQILIKILRYMLNQSNKNITEYELQIKFKEDYEKVVRILKHLEFLRFHSTKGGINNGYYEVRNYNKLMKELQSLLTLRSTDNYRTSTQVLAFYSLMLTLYLLIFNGVDLLVGMNMQSKQNEILIQGLELEKLQIQSSLMFSPYTPKLSFAEYNSEKDMGIYNAEICLINIGEIDTGQIEVKINDAKIIGSTRIYQGIDSKSYYCMNQKFKQKGSNLIPTNVTISVDCVNCNEEVNLTTPLRIINKIH